MICTTETHTHTRNDKRRPHRAVERQRQRQRWRQRRLLLCVAVCIRWGIPQSTDTQTHARSSHALSNGQTAATPTDRKHTHACGHTAADVPLAHSLLIASVALYNNNNTGACERHSRAHNPNQLLTATVVVAAQYSVYSCLRCYCTCVGNHSATTKRYDDGPVRHRNILFSLADMNTHQTNKKNQ